MNPALNRLWWSFVGAALLLGVLIGTASIARTHTGGAFIYPVDDAYIHLAAARRFLESSDRTFLAASSSIAWPWLLVALRFAGVFDSAPLALNVAAAVALYVVVDHAMRSFGVRHASPVALALVLLVPIVPLALSGMEHTTHALFALLLSLAGARTVAHGKKFEWRLAAYAFGAVAFRYEGAFVVVAIAFLFVHARRIRAAIAIVLFGALPALASGVVSIARGGSFLPVPVILKRTTFDVASLPSKIYYRLIDNPHVLVLFALLAFAWKLENGSDAPGDSRALANPLPSRERKALTFIALTTLAAQTTFAQLGWFYRYEAYAVLLALVALAACASTHRIETRAFALPLAVLALPLVGRAAGAFHTSILASENIFDQEVQMASFVRDFYGDRAVSLNDIGAVGYFSNVHIVDLMGLASPRIARARGMRIDGPLTEEEIASIAQDERVAIAIVYDDWFASSIPPEWRRVGSWTIANNHVCAKDTVAFYATSADEKAKLTDNLRAFSSRLPASVRQAF